MQIFLGLLGKLIKSAAHKIQATFYNITLEIQRMQIFLVYPVSSKNHHHL